LKTDSLFYRLFQTRPQLLFDLLGAVSAASAYQFQSVELKRTAFRLDGLFTPPMAAPLFFSENWAVLGGCFVEDLAVPAYERLLVERGIPVEPFSSRPSIGRAY
jgi:hypothetical protein